jgi:hypothetical protein
MKPPVIICHGDKGGVGKTTVARCLMHWLRGKSLAACGFDTDARNPDFYRSYRSGGVPLVVDIRQGDAWLELVDGVEANADKVVVIDFPAGAGGDLADLGGPFFSALRELDRPLWIVWVLNRQMACLTALAAALEDLDGVPFKLVVVKNGYFGRSEEFGLFDTSDVRRQVDGIGASVFWLPSLLDVVYYAADQSNLPLADLVDRASSPLSFSKRVSLGDWLGSVAGEFDRVGFGIAS